MNSDVIIFALIVFSGMFILTAMLWYTTRLAKNKESIFSPNYAIEYSEKLLEFIREVTSQTAILKFKSFIDTHEINKITKANIEKLVMEVATSVNKSINHNLIYYDGTMLTKEFIENYIIETSMITVKNLLDKTINQNN